MGISKLLDYINASKAVSSKQYNGPQGHREMSLMLFKASELGFIEAEQLSTLFEDEGICKESSARNEYSFIPGDQCQLYGYMAEKGDLDNINRHLHINYLSTPFLPCNHKVCIVH
ncbi:hypothetical protein POM88_024474 [Heracleum sosnowskyi]|uniref:XS domain-containing protein n=1 Tax=Heracleum sosnowskyi TaxID=360622 RepID=A0AAD8MIX6_9APIA|nr:hypothetical protein POM88_024474 [Heracleum sosnowskyi]